MPKTPQYIFIHHTFVSYTKNADQWRATDNYHREKGWGGGGYNYEVAANGSIHQFRADGTASGVDQPRLATAKLSARRGDAGTSSGRPSATLGARLSAQRPCRLAGPR